MIRILLSVLLLLILMSGCSKPPVDLGPDFKKFSKDFVRSFRWGDFNGASKFLVEEERDAFLNQFPRNKDLHIIDMYYEKVDLNEDLGEAETVLFFEFYMLPSNTVEEWRWTQQWQRIEGEFPGGGIWLIQTPPPDFPDP